MSYTQRIKHGAALLRIEDRTCVLALDTNRRNKVIPTSTGDFLVKGYWTV